MMQAIENKVDKITLDNKVVASSIKDELKTKAKENENTKPEHTAKAGN